MACPRVNLAMFVGYSLRKTASGLILPESDLRVLGAPLHPEKHDPQFVRRRPTKTTAVLIDKRATYCRKESSRVK